VIFLTPKHLQFVQLRPSKAGSLTSQMVSSTKGSALPSRLVRIPGRALCASVMPAAPCARSRSRRQHRSSACSTRCRFTTRLPAASDE